LDNLAVHKRHEMLINK